MRTLALTPERAMKRDHGGRIAPLIVALALLVFMVAAVLDILATGA